MAPNTTGLRSRCLWCGVVPTFESWGEPSPLGRGLTSPRPGGVPIKENRRAMTIKQSGPSGKSLSESGVKKASPILTPKTEAPFQVQVRTVCLACGKGLDDELCVGPYLAYLVVEFDAEEFRPEPLSDGNVTYDPARLPQVFDSEDNDIPDHPVLLALRGSR